MRRESYCSTSIEPIGIDARRFANVPAQSDATGAGYVYGFQRRSLRLRYLVCPRVLALVRPPGNFSYLRGNWAASRQIGAESLKGSHPKAQFAEYT